MTHVSLASICLDCKGFSSHSMICAFIVMKCEGVLHDYQFGRLPNNLHRLWVYVSFVHAQKYFSFPFSRADSQNQYLNQYVLFISISII